jgi:hypothetical protein
MKNTIATMIVACGLAGTAMAQCNLSRLGMPDFDQRRDDLPSNGGMYCVPTSAINQMAYVANHGVPIALAGPRNWQAQVNYNFVTSRVDLMGDLMDTHPSDGTYGDPALAGLRAYLLAFAPGKFTTCYYYGDYSVNSLVAHWNLGHLINVCYGYYPVADNNRYYRDGGHCVSLNGILDHCDSSYQLRWRDPANDSDNLSTQSTFASKTSDASSQLFQDTDGDLHSRIRLWDLGTSSTTRRYLDSIFAINPLVCLTGTSAISQLQIHRPIQIAGVTRQSSQAIIPGSDTITQVALHPLQTSAFIVTSQLIPREQKVFRHHFATGETVELLSANTTLRIATSRQGQLFVVGDGSVKKYGFAGDTMTLLQEVDITDGTSAVAYDDKLDELVCVTTSGRLIRFRNNLLLPAVNEPLPGAVGADGSVSLAIHEGTQKYYICGSDAPTVWVVGLIPGAPRLRVEATLALPGVNAPEKLQFTDEGTLLLISNGVIGEFGPSAAGGWQPRQGSALAGLPGQRALAVARSRSNFIPGVHDTPAWRNVLVNEGVADVPDCDADFNQDGVLNSQDFFDYLNAFFSSDPAADFNANGSVDSQDFFDFLRTFFGGCD